MATSVLADRAVAHHIELPETSRRHLCEGEAQSGSLLGPLKRGKGPKDSAVLVVYTRYVAVACDALLNNHHPLLQHCAPGARP